MPAAMLRCALAGLFACALAIAQDQPSATRLGNAEKEEFLRTAKVIAKRDIPEGVTHPLLLTLEKDGFKHQAQSQSIDETKSHFQGDRGSEINFRDTWKFNIAAYELGKLLGIDDMIPPSIERKHGGNTRVRGHPGRHEIRENGAFDPNLEPLRSYENAGGRDPEYALWHLAVRRLLGGAVAFVGGSGSGLVTVYTIVIVSAGILLGPSVLDAVHVTPALRAIADLGVFLLVLLAGMEMEVSQLADASRGRSLWVAILGFVTPLAFGVALGALYDLSPTRMLFLGLCLAITALPVSVRILMDLPELTCIIGQRLGDDDPGHRGVAIERTDPRLEVRHPHAVGWPHRQALQPDATRGPLQAGKDQGPQDLHHPGRVGVGVEHPLVLPPPHQVREDLGFGVVGGGGVVEGLVGGVSEGEDHPVAHLHVRGDHPPHGLQRRPLLHRGLVHRAADLRERLPVGGGQQLLAVGEVAVQGAAAHLGRLGDRRQRGVAVICQDSGGRTQDRTAGPGAHPRPRVLGARHGANLSSTPKRETSDSL